MSLSSLYSRVPKKVLFELYDVYDFELYDVYDLFIEEKCANIIKVT